MAAANLKSQLQSKIDTLNTDIIKLKQKMKELGSNKDLTRKEKEKMGKPLMDQLKIKKSNLKKFQTQQGHFTTTLDIESELKMDLAIEKEQNAAARRTAKELDKAVNNNIFDETTSLMEQNILNRQVINEHFKQRTYAINEAEFDSEDEYEEEENDEELNDHMYDDLDEIELPEVPVEEPQHA
jgi:hypothetical protein